MARRPRGLTPDEKDLWSRVARSMTPLQTAGPRPSADDPSDARPLTSLTKKPKPAPAPQHHPAALPQFRVGQAASATGLSSLPQMQTPAQRLAGNPVRMDHKTHRRMSQGKLAPQARLDLHGLTLAAAQPELLGFILSCHANGLRLVLVITGKGRGDHGPLPTRPGALRHQVPQWLHSPPLSAVVQQVTAAHYRHGGEGAYYVYLRRPPG